MEKQLFMNYKHIWTKLSQERIMTSQLIKEIYLNNLFLQEEMKQKENVLVYLKDNIYRREKKTLPCVKNQAMYII